MGEPASDPQRHRLAQLAQVAGPPLIDGRRLGGWPGLPGVLIAGLKSLLMLPVRPGAIPARSIWVVVLSLAILALAIVGDALLLGADAGTFNWLTLRSSAVDLAVLTLASVWLAEPPRSAWSQKGMAREAVPPLHFVVTVLSASFWTVLAGYVVTIALEQRAQTGEGDWLPGIWFYTWLMIWPWWVAIRTIQYQHRYQPIPWWRRAAVVLVLLAIIAWAMADPGEPFWLYDEPEPSGLLYTAWPATPDC